MSWSVRRLHYMLYPLVLHCINLWRLHSLLSHHTLIYIPSVPFLWSPLASSGSHVLKSGKTWHAPFLNKRVNLYVLIYNTGTCTFRCAISRFGMRKQIIIWKDNYLNKGFRGHTLIIKSKLNLVLSSLNIIVKTRGWLAEWATAHVPKKYRTSKNFASL